MAKIGPRLEAEDAVTVLLDQDVGAGDVGRHQVRGELDPVERAVDRVGKGPHEHRLAEPGDALEQGVAVGQKAGQGVADEIALAHDDLADLALDGRRALGEGVGGEQPPWPRRSEKRPCRLLSATGRAS